MVRNGEKSSGQIGAAFPASPAAAGDTTGIVIDAAIAATDAAIAATDAAIAATDAAANVTATAANAAATF